MNEKGITIIELLITAAIVVGLAGAGYTFFLDTSKFQARHERQKDMQMNLQIAMEMLVKEVRHAGYGIMDPIQSNPVPFVAASNLGLGNPITVGTSTASTTDTIGILRVGTQSLGTLTNAMSATNTLITVTVEDAIASRKNDLEALRKEITLITLGGLYTQSLQPKEGAVDVKNDGTFTFNFAGLSTKGEHFPAGFPVEALIGGVNTYAVKASDDPTGTALFQNNVVFAPGIEDLQVAYLLRAPDKDTRELTVDNPGTQPYSAIQLSLMARVLDPDPNWQSATPRPALEDHEAGTSTDQFHRAVLTRIVDLPNDGL